MIPATPDDPNDDDPDGTGETGIYGADAAVGISLYPNPVAANLSISVPQNAHLEVYNATCKWIYSTEVNPGISMLNTSSYEAGIYFVKVVTNEGASCLRFFKS
ncbi:MAG: T9SS type A sorting domain-containing protein [Prevotellaceae bacterium]|jgi:hypothetical protein|nr:T9SS type A sorting domain-containing protein [Prevotellaceae bacterium]